MRLLDGPPDISRQKIGHKSEMDVLAGTESRNNTATIGCGTNVTGTAPSIETRIDASITADDLRQPRNTRKALSPSAINVCTSSARTTLLNAEAIGDIACAIAVTRK